MKHPISRRTLIAGVAAGALLPVSSLTQAQSTAYPNRPIKIIMPWAAGGGGDVLVRAMTSALAQRLGQPVVVDNRPGAIGTIGSQAAARSAADGYTLVYGTADSHSIAPHILKSIPYDSRKEFTAVAPIGFTPLALIVHSSHPAKSFSQFLQMAKQAKQALTYGSWGQGSSGQITMEALKQKAKMDLLHAPYNGTAPLMQGALANQLDCAIVPVLVADQHVKAGSVRMLAVTARERLTAFPDVPLMKEVGVEIDMGPWLGFLAPAGTPSDVVEKLNGAITASIAEPQVAEVMKKMTMVIDKMSSAEYQKFVNSEFDRWGAYIRTAGISLDQ
jgi:tripartite-type tricarboxylate transporter receptor subunit TctC